MRSANLVIWALMLFGGFVLLAAGAGRGLDTAPLLIGPTAHAEATVDGRTIDGQDEDAWSTPPPGAHRELEYSFRPSSGASIVAAIADVGEATWQREPVGSHLDVVYLVSDPLTNWPAGDSPVPENLLGSAFGIAMGVFVAGVGTWRYGPPGLPGRIVRRLRRRTGLRDGTDRLA